MNDWCVADPDFMHAHYMRTICALLMGDERADEFLHQFEKVLAPYNADDCAHEAGWMLKAPRDISNKLLPLARLLAHKAVEKEPDNPEYKAVLDEVIQLVYNRKGRN
jgi:hypothetical protein